MRGQRTVSLGCRIAHWPAGFSRTLDLGLEANLSMSPVDDRAPFRVTAATETHPLQSTSLDSSPSVLIAASCFEETAIGTALGIFRLLTWFLLCVCARSL